MPALLTLLPSAGVGMSVGEVGGKCMESKKRHPSPAARNQLTLPPFFSFKEAGSREKVRQLQWCGWKTSDADYVLIFPWKYTLPLLNFITKLIEDQSQIHWSLKYAAFQMSLLLYETVGTKYMK